MSPNPAVLNRFFISPTWICWLTIPSSTISLYAFSKSASLAPLNTPEILAPSLNAFAKSFGLVNKTPFAPAKAPALIKFLMWVGIDKTVLANWDAPLGINKRFLYNQLAPCSATLAPSLPFAKDVSHVSLRLLAKSNPSAMSCVVYKGSNGLTISSPATFPKPLNSSLTLTIGTTPLVAASAASLVSQKAPRSPFAWSFLFVSYTSSKNLVCLPRADKLVTALKIESLGSFISPNNSLITFGGCPVFSITSFTNFPPGASAKVLFTNSKLGSCSAFPTLVALSIRLFTICLASWKYCMPFGSYGIFLFLSCFAIWALKKLIALVIDSSAGLYLLKSPMIGLSSNIL